MAIKNLLVESLQVGGGQLRNPTCVLLVWTFTWRMLLLGSGQAGDPINSLWPKRVLVFWNRMQMVAPLHGLVWKHFRFYPGGCHRRPAGGGGGFIHTTRLLLFVVKPVSSNQALFVRKLRISLCLRRNWRRYLFGKTWKQIMETALQFTSHLDVNFIMEILFQSTEKILLVAALGHNMTQLLPDNFLVLINMITKPIMLILNISLSNICMYALFSVAIFSLNHLL